MCSIRYIERLDGPYVCYSKIIVGILKRVLRNGYFSHLIPTLLDGSLTVSSGDSENNEATSSLELEFTT